MPKCPKKKYSTAAKIYIQLAQNEANNSIDFQNQFYKQLDKRLSHQNIQNNTDKLIKEYFNQLNIGQQKALQIYNANNNADVDKRQDDNANLYFSDLGKKIFIKAFATNNMTPLTKAFGLQTLTTYLNETKNLVQIGTKYLIPKLNSNCYVFQQSKNGQTFYSYSELADVQFSQTKDGHFSFWEKTKQGLTRLTTGQAVYDFFYNLVKKKILKQNQQIKKQYYKDRQCLKACKRRSKNTKILTKLINIADEEKSQSELQQELMQKFEDFSQYQQSKSKSKSKQKQKKQNKSQQQ